GQGGFRPPRTGPGGERGPRPARGLLTITLGGPTSARTSRPSGRVAGSTPAQVRTCSFPAIRLLPWVMTAEACRMRYVTLLVVQTMQGMRRPQVLLLTKQRGHPQMASRAGTHFDRAGTLGSLLKCFAQATWPCLILLWKSTGIFSLLAEARHQFSSSS